MEIYTIADMKLIFELGAICGAVAMYLLLALGYELLK